MDIEQRLEALEKRIQETKDFIERSEIKDEIVKLKRENGLLKPPQQDIECFGCGS